jgi:hypothetical protein
MAYDFKADIDQLLLKGDSYLQAEAQRITRKEIRELINKPRLATHERFTLAVAIIDHNFETRHQP